MLSLMAVLFLLGGEVATPEYVSQLGQLGVIVEAEGWPVQVTITAIDPAQSVSEVAVCEDVQVCETTIELDACGLWSISVAVAYAHEDPSGSGPYVWGGGAAVHVGGCEVFSDGFETGTTGEWSATTEGEPNGNDRGRTRSFDSAGRLRLVA